MSLGKLLETFKDESTIVKTEEGYQEKTLDGISLRGVLQRGRLKIVREKPPIRQGTSFSPSTITYSYCRRLKVGQMAGLVEIHYEKARPSLQITFDMGNALHELIQGYFWDIGILKGTYKCLKCDKRYHDVVSPLVCPSGKSTHTRKHLKYKEVYLRSTTPDLPISGRCDGILVIDGGLHLMDIKSIKSRTLKSSEREFCFEDLDLQGPKRDHIVQLNLYLWMAGLEKGHLFYISKNDGKIKTFAIPYTPELLEPYFREIRYLVSTAKALKEGKKPELPEPCGRETCPCDEILSVAKP